MDRLLHISDEELQSQQAPKCDLLVYIGVQTVQIAVVDNNRDQVRSVTEYQIPAVSTSSEIGKLISALPEANRDFKFPFNRIKIAVESFRYTFIPSELFEESKTSEYLKFLQAGESDTVYISEVRTAGIRNISVFETSLISELSDLFYKPLFFNQATAFISGIASVQNSAVNTVFLDVQNGRTQIAAWGESGLLFYNIYETANMEEVMYYTLALASEFRLSAADSTVVVSGKVKTGDQLYEMLSKSFQSVELADAELFARFADALQELPSHQYFALLSLIRCA